MCLSHGAFTGRLTSLMCAALLPPCPLPQTSHTAPVITLFLSSMWSAMLNCHHKFLCSAVCSVPELTHMHSVLFQGALLRLAQCIDTLGMLCSASALSNCAMLHRAVLRHATLCRVCSAVHCRFIRHPGYAGWFLWAVGTQVMLANPVCTVAFTCVVWSFFKSRITAEEWYLVRFFGNAYIQYRQQTATFIPFIS